MKIPVEADFNSADIEKKIEQLNRMFANMGQTVAKASGQRFEPITLKTKQDLDYFVKQSQQLVRVQGELGKRMANSGQAGMNPFEANWSKMYLNEQTRMRRMREALVFMGGEFEAAHSPVPPAQRPGGSSRTPPSRAPEPPTRRQPGVGTQWVGGGLRALGPAGGVAAGSLSTGMSMGFGAGLMGLLGGLGALGIGKVVGAATEKMGVAEDNAVAYDRLKRTLGDVNVSFGALKSVLESSADNVKVTFSEAAQLGSQFAKLGNLTADQYKTLSGELQTGVGLSRAFGLDPSQGVGALGVARGMRMTSNEQDSRKFALLIGETIARSNAFAKADEVMDAIAGYTTQQTRASLGANVGGYAGLFSALTGSGIPGLDPTGAAGLLSRVNASLSAGGAKGEASQFMSATIGARYGLDPFQMQLWREGGAFATLDSTFGAGSMASRFGMRGPGGDTTWLGASLSEIRRQYGGNQGMLAHATANHLGINMNQAMAMLAIDPNQTGEMERRLGAAGVSLTDMNAAGIASMAKVMFGSDADRTSVAQALRSRTGAGSLSADEQRQLDMVMGGDDVGAQKELLTRLVASRDQEQTQGKDIRDSKAALDNIKTAVADKLIPLTQEMRNGIMHIAGRGEKSSADIQEEVMRADSRGRAQAIKGKYGSLIGEQDKRIVDARLSEDPADYSTTENSRRIQEEANREIARLKGEQADLLAEENDMLGERIKAMRDDESRRLMPANASMHMGGGPVGRFANGSGARSRAPVGGGGGGRMPKGLGQLSQDPAFRALVSGYEREIGAPEGLLWAQIEQESRYHTNAVSPKGAEGLAQFMPGTRAGLERKFGRSFDPYDPQDAAFMQKELMRELFQQFGNWDDALRGYNAGPSTSRWNNSETRNYVPSIRGIMDRNSSQGTPLPDGGAAAQNSQSFRIQADPIEVIHKNLAGQYVGPSQMLATRVGPASPFGTTG
ncbi:lytic transglycosylase domain-containing protein [Kaistia sp. 32K]|uniref:lytic transglycosylase domain-containing protein n=1 Tax=Kaistia sp. 32K TaxID=2795690 RepID=UPI001915C23B|nr:lytic transglycosylase domain-containing protein [Kaistia sp. 32K]